MNMNFTFLSDDTCKTTIVDAATNSVLFSVSTLFGFRKRTTTITNSYGEVVGIYERNKESERITIRGETMRLGQWLRKESLWEQ